MLLHVLLLVATSVFAQDEQMLGVCVVYHVAFPSGYTEADLNTLFIDHLPEQFAEKLGENAPEIMTSDIVEAYESQQAFCETNEAEVAQAVLELESGDISAETEELLHIAFIEAVAALELPSTSRRQLPAVVGAAALASATACPMCAPLIGAAMLTFAVVYVAWVWSDDDGCRRRLLSRSQQAISAVKRASRLLSTADAESIEIQTMEIITACNNNAPSFVCQLSTVALTQVLTSQLCGGTNLEACSANLQYALGYANAVVNGN